MKTIEYRGYFIKLNKENKYQVFNKYGNYLKQVDNFNHGSITHLKEYIDKIIKK